MSLYVQVSTWNKLILIIAMNSAVLVPGIRSCRTASVSFTWSAIFVRSFLRQKCGSRCYFVVPFSKGDCLEDEVVVKYLKARDSLGKERKVYSAFKKFEEEIPNIYTCLSRYDTTAIVNHLCRDSNSDHKSGIRDSNSDYKGGIRDSNSDYKSGIGDSRNPLSKPGSYSCKHEVIVRLLDSYLSSHVMPELKHLLTFHKYFCRTGDLDNAVKAQDAIFEHHKIQGNKIVELITDAAYAYGLNGEFRYVWGLISYKDIENTISFRKVMYAGLEGMCNSKNIRVGYVDRYYKWFYLPRFPQDSRAMHLYAKYMYNQQRYSECLGIFQLGKKTGCLNKNIYCVLIQAALQLKRTSDAKKLYSLCTKHQKRDLNVSPRSNIKTNLKEGSSAKEGFEKSDKNIKRSFKKNQAKCRDGINSNGTKCDDIKYSNGIKCDDTKSSDSTTDIKSLRNLIYTPNTPLVHMAFEDTENYLQENYEELLSDLIQKHNEFQERSQKVPFSYK